MVLLSVLGDWESGDKVGFVEEEASGDLPFLFFRLLGFRSTAPNCSPQSLLMCSFSSSVATIDEDFYMVILCSSFDFLFLYLQVS